MSIPRILLVTVGRLHVEGVDVDVNCVHLFHLMPIYMARSGRAKRVLVGVIVRSNVCSLNVDLLSVVH